MRKDVLSLHYNCMRATCRYSVSYSVSLAVSVCICGQSEVGERLIPFSVGGKRRTLRPPITLQLLVSSVQFRLLCCHMHFPGE